MKNVLNRISFICTWLCVLALASGMIYESRTHSIIFKDYISTFFGFGLIFLAINYITRRLFNARACANENQPTSSLYNVGELVTVIRACDVTVDGVVVDKIITGNTFRVIATEGHQLWISNGIPGWIDDANVASPETVIRLLTEQILKNRTDANYRTRGMVFEGLSDFERAISDYTAAIQLNPSECALFDRRGACRLSQNDFSGAISDFDEAIRLKPNHWSFMHRGEAWRKLRNYDRAVSDFNSAIRIVPQYAAPHEGIAWICATCPESQYRDADKGVKEALIAGNLSGWKEAAGFDTLAAAYAEAGDFENAVDCQEKALKMEYKTVWKARLDLYHSGKPFRDDQDEE